MTDKTGSVKAAGKPAAKQAAKAGEDKGIRIMNIPLRSEWIKAPRTKRSKRAMNTIREFVAKHTKSYDVKISQKINEKVWTRGIHKPPAKIRVKISKDSKGVVNVMLPEEIMRKPDKKEEKKGRLDQMKESLEKEKKIPGMGGPKEEILKKGKKKEESKDVKEEDRTKEKPREDKSKEADAKK